MSWKERYDIVFKKIHAKSKIIMAQQLTTVLNTVQRSPLTRMKWGYTTGLPRFKSTVQLHTVELQQVWRLYCGE
jgi:hypothetical protein